LKNPQGILSVKPQRRQWFKMVIAILKKEAAISTVALELLPLVLY
jgi:hypothetical protein